MFGNVGHVERKAWDFATQDLESARDSDVDDKYAVYRVVINREEQYSILPIHEGNPEGWTDVGKKGTKEECLAYILQVWTDMRPLSMRTKMDEMFGNASPK